MSQFDSLRFPPSLCTVPPLLTEPCREIDYASVIFVGFGGGAALWYWVWGRKHFRGPAVRLLSTDIESCLESDPPVLSFFRLGLYQLGKEVVSLETEKDQIGGEKEQPER
jgi:hypothetical protein